MNNTYKYMNYNFYRYYNTLQHSVALKHKMLSFNACIVNTCVLNTLTVPLTSTKILNNYYPVNKKNVFEKKSYRKYFLPD